MFYISLRPIYACYELPTKRYGQYEYAVLLWRNLSLDGRLAKAFLFLGYENKIGLLFFVFHIGLLSHASAWANTEVLQGTSLSSGFRFPINFSNGDHKLIRVAQDNADYKISILKDGIEAPLITVDFSSYLGFEELVLVSRENCESCEVLVEGVSRLDHGGEFKITVENKPDLAQENIKSVLKAITEAGYQNYLANTDEFVYKAKLIAAEKLLSKAQRVSLPKNWDWLTLYAQSHLAYTLYYLHRPEDAKQILSSIANSESKSIYKLQALFELASTYDEDVEENAMNLMHGISIAQKLGVERAKAQGLNYLAIQKIRDSNFESAFVDLLNAKAIYERSSNLRGVFDTLHNLSWGHFRAGKLDKALVYASQLKLLAEAYDDLENSLWSLYDLALIYSNKGDVYTSEMFLDAAINRIDKLSASSKSSYNSLYSYLFREKAYRYERLGLWDLARDSANKSIKVLEIVGASERTAELESLLGDIAVGQSNLQKAKIHYEKALAQDIENNRNSSAAIQYLKLAKIDSEIGQHKSAVKNLNLALTIIRKANSPDHASKGALTTLLVLENLKMYERANDLASNIKTLFEQDSVRKDRIEFLYRSASILEALGNYEQAFALLERSEELLVDILSSTFKPGERRALLASHRDVFEAQIRIVQKTADLPAEESLKISEQFRARTLVERLNQIELYEEDDISLKSNRETIISQLVKTAADWYGSRESSISILERSREISQQLENLELELMRERLSKLESQDNNFVSSLDSPKLDEIILSFFVGGKNSWAWVVTKAETRVFEIPNYQNLEVLVRPYMEAISIPPTSGQRVGTWQQQKFTDDLSDALFSKFYNIFQDREIKHLVLVTDSILNGVPIAPLSAGVRNERLFERFSLTYTPSLTARKVLLQKNIQHDSSRALIVSVKNGGYEFGRKIPDLPYAEQEALAILDLLREDSSHLIDEQASKKRLEELLNDEYQVLHLATHGLVSKNEPMLSGLLLGGSGDTSRMWLAPEISRARHSADLVILSACRSATGKSIDGEGMMSLSRAFMESGASQVVGSLWQVQDKSTGAFIEAFYNGLLVEKLEVKEALTYAQRAMYLNTERDWSDPYYWAAFQLNGA